MRLAVITAPLSALASAAAIATILSGDLWLGGLLIMAAVYFAALPLLERWSYEGEIAEAEVEG